MDDFMELMRARVMELLDPQAENLYWAQKDEFYPMIPEPQSYEEEQERQRQWLAAPGDFASAAEQQKYVRSIQRSAFAKEHWPVFAKAKPVVLREKQQARQSMAFTDVKTREINVAPNGSGRLRITALHELAHVIALYEGKDDNHGPKYVGILRQLVAQNLPQHLASLDQKFHKHGVSWTQ